MLGIRYPIPQRAMQIAGMIDDVPTVGELIERIIQDAARLAEQLPEIAASGELRTQTKVG